LRSSLDLRPYNDPIDYALRGHNTASERVHSGNNSNRPISANIAITTGPTTLHKQRNQNQMRNSSYFQKYYKNRDNKSALMKVMKPSNKLAQNNDEAKAEPGNPTRPVAGKTYQWQGQYVKKEGDTIPKDVTFTFEV